MHNTYIHTHTYIQSMWGLRLQQRSSLCRRWSAYGWDGCRWAICMCVCMYVCMYAYGWDGCRWAICVFVCMYTYVFMPMDEMAAGERSTCVCVSGCLYLCTYLCLRMKLLQAIEMCMYVCMYAHGWDGTFRWAMYVCVCAHVYVYVCLCRPMDE